MLRLLHILAITVLVGSAGYAYSTKYETLFYAETLTKLRGKIGKERQAIAVAKAEWALLTRPDRLQRMIEKHLDLQPMTISQLGRLSDIPDRPSKSDEIGQKLEALGLDPPPAVRDRDQTGSIRRPSPVGGRSDEIAKKLQALGIEAPRAKKVTEARKVAEARPSDKPKAATDGKSSSKPAAAAR